MDQVQYIEKEGLVDYSMQLLPMSNELVTYKTAHVSVDQNLSCLQSSSEDK
jgi:hypothetical protein